MHTPLATYRLQFNPHFGFKDAKKIVPYLSELGISDIYASPIFKSRAGSDHGYDIVDHHLLNPELGTAEEFEDLADEVAAHGMGWLQDVVPNHMSYSHENSMLEDVLERGSDSKYYHFFDIEWEHPSLRGRLLAPFLEDLYGLSLDRAEIKLVFDDMGFAVSYHNLRFPLRLKSYARVLSRGLADLQKRQGDDEPALIALRNLIREADSGDPDPGFKRRLWELYSQSELISSLLDSNLAALQGSEANPSGFDLLDDLLSGQLFRLCFWKVASDEINYRRFFSINDLISLHAEDEEVFDHIHSLVFDLVKKGRISGLRIDHLDGLYDPEAYLRRIRERLKEGYLVAEKILLPGDALPDAWPVQGTTGYDFLNCSNGVLCDNAKRDEFDRIYSGFIGRNLSYEQVVYETKKLIADRHMSGDVDNLARQIKETLGMDRYGSDVTLSGIKKALIELLVLFPVYRTYIGPQSLTERDQGIIHEAARKAKSKNLDLFNEIDFVEHLLLSADRRSNGWQKPIMKFQQFTGPLMAKGVEDTAMYIFYRLLSLNEVGGDPGIFGVSPHEFHRFNEVRAKDWPDSMNATSTHDTKRGEDARARIDVLSEIPAEWEKHLEAWKGMNESLKRRVNGRAAPDGNDEYFLYQALIGSFPLAAGDVASYRERARDYLMKAVREAKVHSGWVKPDTSYEVAFVSFLDSVLDSEVFWQDFHPFLIKVAHHGILNSLAQTLIKITAPGIPDFYQGTELWDYSFVDPDNRRPVDFEKRRSYLDQIAKREKEDTFGLIEDMLAHEEDGRLKLFLIHRALGARKQNSGLFSRGTYMRLGLEGANERNLIAFARRQENSWALAVAPRLTTNLQGNGLGNRAWGDARIVLPRDAPASWRNAITGQTIEAEKAVYLRDVLHDFPVALLLCQGEI